MRGKKAKLIRKVIKQMWTEQGAPHGYRVFKWRQIVLEPMCFKAMVKRAKQGVKNG